jgi:2',3'-cyclic-nucleotide 2'-phosphodiesterase (5'-nucleotidase family)
MKAKHNSQKFYVRMLSSCLVLLLFVTSNFVAVSAQATETSSAADNKVTIDILSLNDLHGAVDTAPQNSIPGVAEIVAEIKSYKAKNANTYVVSAGDSFQGTAPSNILYGQPVMDFLKTVGVQYSALGNHEYDWGVSQITDWESNGLQFLACNINMKNGSGAPSYIKPYIITTIGGVKVAFVGLTTPQTAYSTISKNVADIQFTDPAAAAKKYVAQARSNGAQIVLLLAHIGTYQNGTAAPTFEAYPGGTNASGLVDSGADAIITGHSHQEVCGVVKNSAGKAIPVVQAGHNGEVLADLKIVYDTTTKKLVSITPTLDQMYKKTIQPDGAMASALAQDEKKIAPLMNKKLGKNSTPLVRNDLALSNLGEWVCNATLSADQANGTPADIAVVNAHAFHADLAAKTIAMADMYSIMPFDYSLINVKMRGADIKSLFTYGLNGAIANGFGQLQFSGCSVYWHKDPSNVITDANSKKPVLDGAGNQIPVRVIDKIVLSNGEVVTDEGTYTVAANDFMIIGGDNYTMIGKGKMMNIVGGIRNIMADYFKSLTPLSFSRKNLSIPSTRTERSRIVVISDLHLGADNRFDELQKNKPALIKFLKQVKSSNNVGELVIAGDLIDQWVMPMDYKLPAALSAYNNMIVKNNQEVVDTINSIIKQGNICVTYVPGNHDMLFNAFEASRLFPGINQARDVEGLGSYRPASQIAIEHGHRYNIYCAPDPFSNIDLTGGKSILPSGYFYTRIGTSSFMEGHPKASNTLPAMDNKGVDRTQLSYYNYYLFWKNSLAQFPLTDSFSDKLIKTGIDGYKQTFSVNDLIPYKGTDGKFTVNLFKNSVENWTKRQSTNNVPVPVDTNAALNNGGLDTFTDDQAQSQYFNRDANVKVVIFGHTHVAKLILEKNLNKQDVIYANSGTWIDHTGKFPSRTYVTIDRDTASSKITVSLNQFNDDGTSTVLNTAQISLK